MKHPSKKNATSAPQASLEKQKPGNRRKSVNSKDKEKKKKTLKIIPVKNNVLFPGNTLPFPAGKEWSSIALGNSAEEKLGILTQKKNDVTNPQANDLYTVGTEAKIVKLIKFPDNSYGAVVQGIKRFRVVSFLSTEANKIEAEIEYLTDSQPKPDDLEFLGLGKAMKQLAQKAISLLPNINHEASVFIENAQDPLSLCNIIIPYLSVDPLKKQEILETDNADLRLRAAHSLLSREIELLEISQKINTEAKNEMGKQQKKYYIREQLKALQKELNEIDGRPSSGGGPGSSQGGDPTELYNRVVESLMTNEGKEAGLREIERMSMMSQNSPEYMVSFTYVNWLLDLPWQVESHKNIDLKKARHILESDHNGLEKVKKRILEFLAVCTLKKSLKGPILLFVGPPGVGKTSLGRSIARALDRKFARISLGGVRDDAEIRGHRRTYVGSLPGKIIDTIKKAGCMDPVILLDEIDKLSSEGRGDPASALLEVLDPEQNSAFIDHYLNVPVDLSKIFFIATANNLSTILPALRDRMEVIELESYTLHEKLQIAQEHLLPQVIEETGLKHAVRLAMDNDVMESLIQLYTREPGVRQLKRELASVARCVAIEALETTKKSAQAMAKRKVTLEDVKSFLGTPHFNDRKLPTVLPIGVATGLAWTANGGEILYIETAMTVLGSGKITLTGQLGEVMQESVQTAFSYIRAHPDLCHTDLAVLEKKDIHVHFPEGSVKKDGPSAGIAAFAAIVSQLAKIPLLSSLAMTGEISLRGDVLPVGGVKEKLLAAHRYGITHALIPKENERNLLDLSANVLSSLRVTPVSTLSEVIEILFKENAAIQEAQKNNALKNGQHELSELEVAKIHLS